MNYYILMADIINSRKKNEYVLMQEFKHIVNKINFESALSVLSPLTITLGDEFQCIVMNLQESIKIIFNIEEAIVHNKADFKLRFALHYGEINTPINHNIAYEMLGPGLSKTRNLLMNLKKSKNNSRFYFDVNGANFDKALNDAFFIYQSFIDNWDFKDYALISKFLDINDYKIVASQMKKDKSLMWKREKSLKITEYKTIKELINLILEKKL
jgi:hypothetical protein